MPKGRLEAFSDGVIAILITIMVLELRTPVGTSWHALQHELPVLLAYALSFVYLGIYWNNHHHMLAAASRVTGGAMWKDLSPYHNPITELFISPVASAGWTQYRLTRDLAVPRQHSESEILDRFKSFAAENTM